MTPDLQAGTARTLKGAVNDPNYYTFFSLEIRDAVRAQLGTLPANGNTIIYQALYRLFLKIKDVVRKGGSVTLDHWGTFGVSWTNPRTTRDKVTGVFWLLYPRGVDPLTVVFISGVAAHTAPRTMWIFERTGMNWLRRVFGKEPGKADGDEPSQRP